MSCTISALPFLLIFSALTAAADNSASSRVINNEEIERKMQAHINSVQGEAAEELTPVQLAQLKREYKTVFMDKDVLIKTLKEYGLIDFTQDGETISARVDNFNMIFYRQELTQPYYLRVYSVTSCDEATLINDLNTEYALNVQEETYMKIKERISNKNLKIDNEEVLEDDSIVLTINID